MKNECAIENEQRHRLIFAFDVHILPNRLYVHSTDLDQTLYKYIAIRPSFSDNNMDSSLDTCMGYV